MKKLLLIDTFNFLHRAYHALPDSFRDPMGEPVNAVYGVTSMLINVLNAIKPDYAIAALDGIKPTFRVEDFTGYKAHRRPMDNNLSIQIPKVFEVLEAYRIKTVVVDGYEADDVIGTMAVRFASDTDQAVIVSNDRDLWQLVNKNVVVMIPTTTGQAEWVGHDEVRARMGLEPYQIPDYKGLRGDPSDNIPGVYGVGEKTAVKLIQEYGNVENVYRNIDKIEPLTLRNKLAASAEDAVMSKKLATIILDVPVDLKLDDCCYHEFNKEHVIEVMKKYNFKSLIKRLGGDLSEEPGTEKEAPENQTSLF